MFFLVEFDYGHTWCARSVNRCASSIDTSEMFTASSTANLNAPFSSEPMATFAVTVMVKLKFSSPYFRQFLALRS